MSAHVEMANPEATILEEIADPCQTKRSVALTYAFCLRSPAGVDWPKVNRAIVRRWSLDALAKIKKEAWRLGS